MRQIKLEIDVAAQAGKILGVFVTQETRIADSVYDWEIMYGVRALTVPFP